MKTYLVHEVSMYPYPPVKVEADGMMIQDGNLLFYKGNLWHGPGAQDYSGDFVSLYAPGTFGKVTTVEESK